MDLETFKGVTTWVSEIKEKSPENNEILLIGLKIDLRDESNSFTSVLDGWELADKIGAIGYLECSSLTGEGIKEIKDEMLKWKTTDDYEIPRNCSSQIKSARK